MPIPEIAYIPSISRLKIAWALIVATILGVQTSGAGPVMPAGDSLLRHDIQLLADHGVISGPIMSWPLAWGPVLEQIKFHDFSTVDSPMIMASLLRVRSRAQWETRSNVLTFSAEIGGAKSPTDIRAFEDTPRESIEAGGGVSWTGNRITVTARGQLVDQANGSGEARADGSLIGVAVGNFLISANTLDRWWGPGWDGSLILSSNARAIPSLSVDRIFTDAFESKWLSWLGPWDVSIMMGELESKRFVPNTRFFGMRFNFRPNQSLEIGLSRTAQWCGDGRPCDASTFVDLVLGRDNLGDAGIGIDNEPGNQMAGIDFRWSSASFGVPAAFYGQFIGEDEAGGFPSRYLGQVGAEAIGQWQEHWSWRWFGELAVTSCNFYESEGNFDCAYNHGIYQTGYRYRGRSIGHGSDNDARLYSSGLMLANIEESRWRAIFRVGQLNRGGGIDPRNTVASSPVDLLSFDLSHQRDLKYGVVEVGAGYAQSDVEGGSSVNESRFYLQWRNAY